MNVMLWHMVVIFLTWLPPGKTFMEDTSSQPFLKIVLTYSNIVIHVKFLPIECAHPVCLFTKLSMLAPLLDGSSTSLLVIPLPLMDTISLLLLWTTLQNGNKTFPFFN